MSALSVVPLEGSSKVPAISGKEISVRSADLIEVEFSAKDGKWFVGLANWLSPKKPATAIHHLTGEAERTCYRWVEGSADPTSRALIKMIRSSEGERVLDYIMRGCKQAWWAKIERAREVARAYDAASDQFEMKFGGAE